ncbi:MAG: hypothetical protein Kow0021_16710 [Methanothermobacter thermautotrophicus]|uniref:DUF86 domain-containing protein n=1 Tax=Methanothermobacter thermautotrophicus (strain ATCC 29096 / DSM 1053 / JCM 10044 / NBRC 100330 / Delta H) TaxID=187420 RepID=O26509_METTH|nr:unknown [Methanothermobacter thermautotrophicus str. Delta H]MDK2875066.1 hypothetical protein [Methanothermobacter sp.]MDN5374553.1 hypothetical protein [Methanothermobacter sp.]BAZ98451.1 hypothetical protein tca_00376 [Methanothermobacter sp. EMTCatA1]
MDKFAPAAGFRNLLLHMYAEIDIEKVYGYLQNNLDDINNFARFIAEYLKKS